MNQMKPILFNTEMVRAILDGRKTVTRRIADINTEIPCGCSTDDHEFVPDNFNHRWVKPTGFVCRRCGFGVAPPHSRVPCGESLFRPRYWPGDILYVRETWTKLFYVDPDGYTHYDQPMLYYAADGTPDITLVDEDGFEEDDQRIRWKPSIHMPKEAARIFLRVTDVRVERLQDMTEEDAEAEGCGGCPYEHTVYFPEGGLEMCVNVPGHCSSPGYRYCEHSLPEIFGRDIWDSTIKPAYLSTKGWEANPWVWVIKFEQISKEESI